VLRSYLFAHALKTEKGLDYPVSTDDDNKIASIVKVEIWLDLVNQYLCTNRPGYSVEGVIKSYCSGEITPTSILKDKTDVEYGNTRIVSVDILKGEAKGFYNYKRDPTERYLKCILVDNNKYDKITFRFVLYNNQVLFKDTLLWSGSLMNRLSAVNSNLNIKDIEKDLYRASIACHKYLFENGATEIYKILPKPSKGKFIRLCTDSSSSFRPWEEGTKNIPMVAKPIGKYMKYSLFKGSLNHINGEMFGK